jgi:dolichyl-phosphate-mannose--protein O-mannosyl transferase
MGYDHPFFGPLFLAVTLSIIGYPSSSSHDLVNRDLFRSLCLVPTNILVYKIGEIRYGKKVAIIAAVLFVMMPLTWMFRMILLDSLLMTFLLLAIFLAICTTNSSIVTLD